MTDIFQQRCFKRFNNTFSLWGRQKELEKTEYQYENFDERALRCSGDARYSAAGNGKLYSVNGYREEAGDFRKVSRVHCSDT